MNDMRQNAVGALTAARGILAGLLLCTAFAAHAQANPPPVPEVLWYKFDQAGTSLTNYASAPPAGTATATIMGGSFTQSNAFSATAKALAGTGQPSSSDYVNTGWAENVTGSWTMSFFTSDIVPSATLWYILGDVNAGSFRCFTNGVAGANNWILRGPVSDVLINGGATAAPHMIAFVYDQPAGAIRGYLDGVLVNTVAQASASIVGAGPFKVGGYSSNATLNGKMADFRFYSHALTDTEIQAINTYVLHSFFVGGTVMGTGGNSGLTLQLNGGQDLAVNADGNFQFPLPLSDTASYAVTVASQPPGKTCTVTNGSGLIGNANITDVAVACQPTAAAVAVTVDDGQQYAQYGKTLVYTVVVSNGGGTNATGVQVSSLASEGLDLGNATWNCMPANGATCTASGMGPFGDTVSLPALNGSAIYLVSVPVFSITALDTVQFQVNATGAMSASDSDTLVIFRNGFE